MKRLKLNIKLENAAFDEDRYTEIARILRQTATDIESIGHNVERSDGLFLVDINGNRVGKCTITEDKK